MFSGSLRALACFAARIALGQSAQPREQVPCSRHLRFVGGIVPLRSSKRFSRKVDFLIILLAWNSVVLAGGSLFRALRGKKYAYGIV